MVSTNTPRSRRARSDGILCSHDSKVTEFHRRVTGSRLSSSATTSAALATSAEGEFGATVCDPSMIAGAFGVCIWKRARSSSSASCSNLWCPCPIHWPPRSSREPSADVSASVRPPTRSAASSTSTSIPCRWRSRAAIRPDTPAPTIATVVCWASVFTVGLLRPGWRRPHGSRIESRRPCSRSRRRRSRRPPSGCGRRAPPRPCRTASTRPQPTGRRSSPG
ncbi:Uncharacterised protein [Mycobacteroides abscessus subsp. abscessus]|nr:Uncharacterised protein [Mycobacteroides abscessus subsp. abscessus]